MLSVFKRTTVLFFFFIPVSKFTFAQPVNNLSSAATNITPVTSCGATSGETLYQATSTGGPVSSCGTANDVWYTFTTPANVTSVQISVTVSGGSNLDNTNAFIEAFNARTTADLTISNTLGCNNIGAGLSLTGLSPSTLYYFRVFTSAAPTSNPSNKWTFNVCVSYVAPVLPPANDECSGATTLTVGTTNSSGTVWAASASSGIPTGCASGTPDDDVWYTFTATSTSAIVTLSSIGPNLSSSGALVQLFSGSCGSLVSLACGYTNLSAAGLSIGSTYYVRVYSSAAGSIGGVASGSAFSIAVTVPSTASTTTVGGSRMNEIFLQTILAPVNTFENPWEIAYGPDGYLWITESRGYKVYKMDPNTGLKSTVLDISQNSPFLPVADQSFNLQFNFSGQGNPQGGLAGLALHPNFMHATTPKNYVYLSYIHTYVSTAANNGGIFFTNRLVRFTYNTTTGLLESPVSLCDTLPGSSDHNSQRMIIAPVSGTYYLFYAEGDMGSGQYTNLSRAINAQNMSSYEGKILRFNLEADGDAGTLDKWIPNDNPFNGTAQSAVWSSGIRNNQGFAYANINGTDYLYGSSHGPFSDDELNIIERGKNYGHPIVIGYSSDGNYDGAKAGPSNGSLPAITSESANAATIGSSYKDPIFTFYSAPKGTTTTTGTIQYIYNQVNSGNGANGDWPSEAPSGMDIYTNSFIPGWKNSLLLGLLKGGKAIRLKLSTTGATIASTAGSDTVGYFRSVNRFRDVAISPDGHSIFTIIDKSSTTSGPTSGSPMVSACAGCVQKYTFLGYADAGGKSSIPTAIDVTPGVLNNCTSGTSITIDNSNNNLWVPITGPDGNILAEIKANGNNLGTVTSSLYTKSGALRQQFGKRYLHRNITITPAVQPSSAVAIRLYMTKAEFDEMDADAGSGVSAITDLKILKNNDACGSAIASNTQLVNPDYAEAHGTDGYVLQANINSFSSFYFGTSAITLPVELVYFKGSLQNNSAVLQWETINENNASHFIVERSTDNRNFESIGKVSANGNSTAAIQYSHVDNNVNTLSSTIIYYRLKMVDADGQYKYSSIVTIALADITNKIIVSPNPATDETKLTIIATKSGKATWKLIDNGGRLLKQNVIHIKKGNNNVFIPVAGLSAGLYYLQVSGAGLDQNIKLQKL
ncbi:PQQ-dependent sugar dehydrogenase [Terrimonas alba]|uniref:PQQ-dependent sugar dehydrogenase n=1 Tax=Terrimonas alba TaxID=3349636 RepID=UPI0035F23D7B